MAQAQAKKIYNELEKELREHVITLTSADRSPLHTQRRIQELQPVASLVIPNKLYLLWDRKISLQNKMGMSVSKRLELANDRIGGTIKAKAISTVEKRLEKESIRRASYMPEMNG